MAATEVKETSVPLKQKKSVFRVSVHCEGCKKKVSKILRRISGVESVEIDIRQQKVTVIGDVEAETLLRKLIKSGKNAQLWPEVDDPKDKKPIKSTNKEKQNDSQTSSSEGHGGDESGKEIKEPAKAKVVQDAASGKSDERVSSVKNGVSGGSSNGDKGKEIGGPKNGVADGVKEPKFEGKKPETESESKQSPPQVSEKTLGEGDGGAKKADISSTGGVVDGVSGKKEKKKKKGQIRNNVEGEPSSRAPTSTGPPNHNIGSSPVSMPTNNNPPRHAGFFDQHPSHYYAPPPLYTVNYSMTHPSAYTTSYYTTPPPPASHAYYSYTRADLERPPPYDLGMYQQQPLESFEIFSDENPNGCSIM